MKYIVKSVVCDYGVYQKNENQETLIDICNSLSNAELIADILNTDLRNTKFDVVERSKIDKAIEEIREYFMPDFEYHGCGGSQLVVETEDVIEILKRNIGE